MDFPIETLQDLVSEMLRLRKLLPLRPSLDEVEAAQTSILGADEKLASRLEKLFRQTRPASVPTNLYRALQEMREDVLRSEAVQEKRAAGDVIELEERHRRYDVLIQKVHHALQSKQLSISSPKREFTRAASLKANLEEEKWDSDSDDSGGLKKRNDLSEKGGESSPISVLLAPRTPDEIRSRRLLMNGRLSPSKLHIRSASLSSPVSSPQSPVFEPALSTIHEDGSGTKFLLEKKLDRRFSAEMLLESERPKRSKLGTPDVLWNANEMSILDLSGSQLEKLPDSIGEFWKLTELHISSCKLTCLPESLGRLTKLRYLNISKNFIEELPWTIGQCTALIELNADFNQLKALPEGIGQLCKLQRLSLHLNCLKGLPTTIASLSSLVELELHFNHLQSLPESLCSVTSLTRLNLSSNFTELTSLPLSFGNLQKLQFLDISYNHLTVLPDSFALLTNLRTLRMEGNPIVVPPADVASKGTEAVIQYMVDYVAKKETQKEKWSGLMGKLISPVTCCFAPSEMEISRF